MVVVINGEMTISEQMTIYASIVGRRCAGLADKYAAVYLIEIAYGRGFLSGFCTFVVVGLIVEIYSQAP
ncbi:hypothetical protein EDM02_02505 [Candidatus Cardinium hertigii]|uniref:Uncharacterized protein n=1 Tax=Candidatus Cardinium hertigii TaxID=247481 RepID=A0A3N2QCJ1_9BACT|nr:hypothetical protein EDM02_02505 [Candidatus Cardinium hertigii]